MILTFDSIPAAGLRDLLHLRARDLAAAQCHRRSSMAERARNFRARPAHAGSRNTLDGGRACRLSRCAARERDQAAELLPEVC